jgi:Ca2+-binding EF-hand superfamily protein
MRKLTLCVLGLLLTASPALAQMGGGGGGMGGMGGMGGGGMGGHGASGPSEVEPDTSPDNGIGTHDRPHEMKPISREQFDKVVTQMFGQADLNRDGMVTLAELQSVIDARRDVVIRARFKDMDGNHDGHIDVDEFIAWQRKQGSVAASDCSVYAGHIELVPETLGPALGDSERDEALAIAVEPLSATLITKANVHYNRGVTLDDVLAYENARFDAADTNHDGFLVQPEISALRHSADHRRGRPGPGIQRDEALDN